MDFHVKNNIFIGDDNVSHFKIKILAMLSEDLSKHLPLQSRVIRAKVEHVFHCFDFNAISACRRVNYFGFESFIVPPLGLEKVFSGKGFSGIARAKALYSKINIKNKKYEK